MKIFWDPKAKIKLAWRKNPSKKMKELGREHLISKENCIEDWVTVHWAYEVQMLTEG